MLDRDASRRRRAISTGLAFLSLFSVALVLARYGYFRESHYGGLIWNLFLAWIPFGLAICIYDRHRMGARPAVLLPLGAAWLLFLPNAPYILTDFKHLEQSERVPLWYDVVLIGAPAWTGMMLGLLSLYLVQAVVRPLAGTVIGWVVAVGALGLASFGVYLGRVMRWNSWDILTDPHLLTQLDGVLVDSRAVVITILLTVFLTLSYLILYALLRLDVQNR